MSSQEESDTEFEMKKEEIIDENAKMMKIRLIFRSVKIFSILCLHNLLFAF